MSEIRPFYRQLTHRSNVLSVRRGDTVSSAIVVPRRIYQVFISALPWQLFRITVKTDKCLINPLCDNSSTKKSVDGHFERQDGSLFGKLGFNPFIFLKIKASNFNPYFYAPARSIEELLNELFTHLQVDDASFTDPGGQLLLIRLKTPRREQTKYDNWNFCRTKHDTAMFWESTLRILAFARSRKRGCNPLGDRWTLLNM